LFDCILIDLNSSKVLHFLTSLVCLRDWLKQVLMSVCNFAAFTAGLNMTATVTRKTFTRQ